MFSRFGFFAASLLFSLPAFAGEGLFSRAYTTETVPEGHYELEETIRQRTHRAFGQYTAYDFKSEFEYGITDNFQAAFYVNALRLDAGRAPDDNDDAGEVGMTRHGLYLSSLAAEFIYRVMSPIKDKFGLAFYFEPEWDMYDIHNGNREYQSMSNEFRILFQKNFLDDQLILVYNLVLETEYFRYLGRAAAYQGELDWNNEIGATYHVAPQWFVGVEGRNHNEAGNFWSHDHSVYWAGPVVHYASPKFWATLGFLTEVYGVPSGPDEQGSNQGPGGMFLHSHEQFETTLKVAMPF